jgi:hypothetical protein
LNPRIPSIMTQLTRVLGRAPWMLTRAVAGGRTPFGGREVGFIPSTTELDPAVHISGVAEYRHKAHIEHRCTQVTN